MESNFIRYDEKIRELREKINSAEFLVTQMAEQKYTSLDTYLNNMNIILDIYRAVGRFLQDAKFHEHLKKCDLNLYINILSIGRSIALMRNLLINLQLTLGKAKISGNE